MLVRASMCVCVCSLLLLHCCLFYILLYCISCGEELDSPGMVLNCMISVMILNLVLILNKSSIQFIQVNLSDRQLQIENNNNNNDNFFCSLYTIIFLCNMLSLCWRALVCVWLTRLSWAIYAPNQVCETGDYTHLVILQGEIPLLVAPKLQARRLEPPGSSIYMYYGVSYHMFAFLFERTFLVIHCQTHLWSLLLTLIGSWTAPSLQSQYRISLRYISYFILLLLCFSLVVVFGACY